MEQKEKEMVEERMCRGIGMPKMAAFYSCQAPMKMESMKRSNNTKCKALPKKSGGFGNPFSGVGDAISGLFGNKKRTAKESI